MTNKGKFTLIAGPMFSGKTTYLIEQLKKLEGKKVLVVKPKIDNRYKHNKISTHNGKTFPSLVVDSNNPLSIINLYFSGCEILFIDEVNFWSFKNIWKQINFFLKKNVDITAAGVLYSFRQDPLGATLALKKKANIIKELFAVCDQCKKQARFNYRKKNISKKVVVGAGELYGACCNKCYEKLNKAK